LVTLFVGIKSQQRHSNNKIMAANLIVDFPHHQRKLRVLQFAETAQLYIYKHHDAARHELWYTKSEYYSMKLAIKEDVLEVRAQALASHFNYAGNGDVSAVESSGCWIGIAHLLTPACMDEVRACRARCTRAVLAEQASQGSSSTFRWEAIALASFAQTRKAGLRARKLGKLHQDLIELRALADNLEGGV
jgi:hypothetical protein